MTGACTQEGGKWSIRVPSVIPKARARTKVVCSMASVATFDPHVIHACGRNVVIPLSVNNSSHFGTVVMNHPGEISEDTAKCGGRRVWPWSAQNVCVKIVRFHAVIVPVHSEGCGDFPLTKRRVRIHIYTNGTSASDSLRESRQTPAWIRHNNWNDKSRATTIAFPIKTPHFPRTNIRVIIRHE